MDRTNIHRMDYIYSFFGYGAKAPEPVTPVERKLPEAVIAEIRSGVVLRKTSNMREFDDISHIRLMADLEKPQNLRSVATRPYEPIRGLNILDRCVRQLQEKIREHAIILSRVVNHKKYINEHDQFLEEVRHPPALKHVDTQPAVFMTELQKKLQIRRQALNWI